MIRAPIPCSSDGAVDGYAMILGLVWSVYTSSSPRSSLLASCSCHTCSAIAKEFVSPQ